MSAAPASPRRALTVAVLTAIVAVAAPAAQRQGSPPTPSSVAAGPPRLVVMLVADQFREDYIDRYSHQWTKGLRRLVTSGAVFPLAAYPYSGTVTCPGHATIATGTVPATHGMIGNEWYDRTLKQLVSCTADPQALSVPLGPGAGTEHHSPRSLRGTTLADEMRAQGIRQPHILSLSLKPRSAIGLGGHPGPNTMVLWEEDNGTWATSDAYTKTPWPDVEAHVKAHPIAAAYGATWDRALPAARYLGDDDVEGEVRPRTFPHVLDSRTGQPDNAFITRWEKSPWSDAYLGDLAIALIQSQQLGRHTGTDFLGLSFSALDLVGHDYGPDSHEVQDVLVRLDGVIGRLLDALDASVGPGRYVIGFSSDHGAAPLPEVAAARGVPAGRLSSTTTRQAVQTVLASAFGEGTHVARASGQHIYLSPGILDRIAAQPGLAKKVDEALLAIPGIARVYWADALASKAASDDATLRAMRLSYVADRSGDIIVVPQPYWMFQATGTTHGTPYGYDQRVPVIFFGAGIRAGEYPVPASPADIAPTLAFLARVTMARTDGRVLTDALVKR